MAIVNKIGATLRTIVDLNRAAIFTRVVEAGGFSAAAAALRLPRSSVSRAVAALERELGVRLLQRTTRAIALTDAGRAFHDRVRPAIAGLRDAEASVASLGKEPRGVVRL